MQKKEGLFSKKQVKAKNCHKNFIKCLRSYAKKAVLLQRNLNLSGINANNQQKKRNELNRQSSLIKAGENILKSSDMPNIMYKNKNMESQTGVSLLVNNPDVSIIK